MPEVDCCNASNNDGASVGGALATGTARDMAAGREIVEAESVELAREMEGEEAAVASVAEETG